MSRFSPSVPKPSQDPGIRVPASPTNQVFKRTGSIVNTQGGTDPGALLPAVENDVQFRRTGEQVGPWNKSDVMSDKTKFSPTPERSEKISNRRSVNEPFAETKPRSNSTEVSMLQNHLPEKLIEKEDLEDFRERANSIPQPLPIIERKLGIGAFSTKGKRKKNEDAHVAFVSLPTDEHSSFFGVFDGHGGKNASNFCQKKMPRIITSQKAYPTDKRQALIDGFIQTDREYNEKLYNDGTTAVVALISDGNKLFVANVGDSRCILYRNKDRKIYPLSQDHKPENKKEKERIEAAGHEVSKESLRLNGQKISVYRVDGQLGVARSIGDSNYKDNPDLTPEEQAVSCYPDVTEDKVEQGDILILACDGLWDVMSNEQVVDFILNQMKSTNIQQATEKLTEEAIQLGSEDNISAVVVQIQ